MTFHAPTPGGASAVRTTPSARRALAIAAVALTALAPMLGAQQPTTPTTPPTPPTVTPPVAQPPVIIQTPAPQSPPPARRPRPYRQVVTDRAVSDTGGITVHRLDDRWLFEVPDSLLLRDMLFVTRIAAVPANFGGFLSAGSSIAERLVRWERNGDRLVLRGTSVGAFADDSLPIALSVASNHLGPIIAAFPVLAFGRDSASVVVDVTEFFAGDTPGISGLSTLQRRVYQVRRLDPARSFVNAVKSFPENVEVRHTQTFDAAEPPSDRGGGTISLEMRQSIVLLPRVPMRPRFADARAGFFSVSRINYGLDEQKAAQQSFIRRWRLEPSDREAYARGELVEPVKPIVYYLDPATPAKWRASVRQGIEDWQPVFEKAGFRRAIVARDAPTAAEDPDWDPEDIRYSVVRWAASTVRNAIGPSTSDPRTGEIIESDITWYHNHMRSYRNRLMIETGAANPAVRTLDIPEELMGETMRRVITHEVGHALGLPHNMVASASFAVDSLRSRSFASRYGVSATIMDYARQNYVAQPGDGLQSSDFIRRLGPFDDFIIEWGYRAYPQAPTPEEERPILNRLLAVGGPMRYRYLPQFLSGIDPRAQTEDVGDDPIRASSYAIANLKRVVPNLVRWTSRAGEDYEDLAELYGETLGMWSLYMGHVASVIGGTSVDLRTSDQAGAVYRAVPAARQRAALAFLAREALRTQAWLAPADILSRIGPPSGATSVAARQAALLAQLLDGRRLARLADAELLGGASTYSLTEYMDDLRREIWEPVSSATTPDAGRRSLQRAYLERLAALIAVQQQAVVPGAPPEPVPSPLLAIPNVGRSDIPALARIQLRAIREQARRAAPRVGASGIAQAHWLDVADRVQIILDPLAAARLP